MLIAAAVAMAIGVALVATRHETDRVTGVAASESGSAAAPGELVLAYIPTGYTNVGHVVRPEPDAPLPHVNNVWMYDLKSKALSFDAAARQFTVNVMVGATDANQFAGMLNSGATSKVLRNGRNALLLEMTSDDVHPWPETQLAWLESPTEAVFISSRGLDSPELLKIAEGMTRR
jgi:hypothetical protein